MPLPTWTYFLAALWLFGGASLQANMGGYLQGGNASTGSIKAFTPEGTEFVHIADEDLDIALGSDRATVKVRYTVENLRNERVRLRFGFPVEELKMQNLGGHLDGVRNARRLEYCRNYGVALRGRPIKAVFKPEKATLAGEVEPGGLSGWLISEAELRPRERAEVLIQYQSDYTFNEAVGDATRIAGARLFKYRLSTGAVWAGPIARGRVVIRPDGADPDDIKVLAPSGRFTQKDGRWEWNFTALEPTLADDFSIEAVAAETVYRRHQENGRFDLGQPAQSWRTMVDLIERRGNWWMAHRNYEASASSSLPAEKDRSYDAAQVREGGTWSEGVPGLGIGEWLELRPRDPRPLQAVRIWSGYGYRYGEQQGLYTQNGRPRRLEVSLNNEYRFEIDVQDHAGEQRFLVPEYQKAVRAIRLTIKDVYAGTKYQDTCINRIELEVPLLKRPKIQRNGE